MDVLKSIYVIKIEKGRNKKMPDYRNSEIRIYKDIKVDKRYFNVLDPMSNSALLTSLASNLVATNSAYSFIRETGAIETDFNYTDLLKCNYVAFRNPDYSNRWFFGWIDRVDYVNDHNKRITYTLDIWNTWSNEFVFDPVFVEREHVNLDVIGEHILPEPIAAGVTSPQNIVLKRFNDYDLVINIALDPSPDADPIMLVENYPNTCHTYCFHTDTLENVNDAKDLLADALSAGRVLNCVMYPTAFTGNGDEIVSENLAIPKPLNLNGYVPVNNKLFTYPYSYLAVDNCSMQTILRYENFGDINNMGFVIRGFANPIAEITCIPKNYELINENPYHSITIRDFPQLPMVLDTYMAWVAQKSNSALLSAGSGIVSGAAMGAIHGGVYGAAIGAVGGLIAGAASYGLQEQQAADAPDSIHGGNSSGIIDAAVGTKGFYFKQMALKYDNALSIDNFFSQFGYNVSCVKVPNLTGRQYWNYVKINGVAGHGEIPEAAREKINDILNKGVTIWHSHNYLGNYKIGGDKMQNPIT